MHDPHGDDMTSGRQWELALFLLSFLPYSSIVFFLLIHLLTSSFISLGNYYHSCRSMRCLLDWILGYQIGNYKTQRGDHQISEDTSGSVGEYASSLGLFELGLI